MATSGTGLIGLPGTLLRFISGGRGEGIFILFFFFRPFLPPFRPFDIHVRIITAAVTRRPSCRKTNKTTFRRNLLLPPLLLPLPPPLLLPPLQLAAITHVMRDTNGRDTCQRVISPPSTLEMSVKLKKKINNNLKNSRSAITRVRIFMHMHIFFESM